MITNEFDWEKGDDAFPLENVPLTEDRRTEARICAVQGLFQSVLMGKNAADIAKEFEVTRLSRRKADKKLFALIMAEAAAGTERYREMISSNLSEGWEWGRMDPVLRALLWAGCAEMTANDKVGLPVVVNEYINISKGFLDEEQVGFVNRLLDLLGRKIRGQV